MSRHDNGFATISVEDVVHTLRECQRDWKYSGRFEPMLAFASELTGISEDALAEMMYEERVNDGGLKIVDRFDNVCDGVVYGVQVAPNRFVDVKVYEEDGRVGFLGPVGGDENIYAHVYDENGKFLSSDFLFDGVAVLKLVKEHVMEHECLGVDVILNEASARSEVIDNAHAADREIEKLWDELEDVPFDDNECLDVDWNGWSKGTHREEIWHWFDEHHSKGVGWLVNEYESDESIAFGKD